MRAAIQRNHARVVNGLHLDDHLFRRLDNLEITLVSGSQPRRAKGDAALAQRPVLGAGGEAAPIPGGSRLPGLGFRGPGRQTAIGRIGDKRSSVIPIVLVPLMFAKTVLKN